VSIRLNTIPGLRGQTDRTGETVHIVTLISVVLGYSANFFSSRVFVANTYTR